MDIIGIFSSLPLCLLSLTVFLTSAASCFGRQNHGLQQWGICGFLWYHQSPILWDATLYCWWHKPRSSSCCLTYAATGSTTSGSPVHHCRTVYILYIACTADGSRLSPVLHVHLLALNASNRAMEIWCICARVLSTPDETSDETRPYKKQGSAAKANMPQCCMCSCCARICMCDRFRRWVYWIELRLSAHEGKGPCGQSTKALPLCTRARACPVDRRLLECRLLSIAWLDVMRPGLGLPTCSATGRRLFEVRTLRSTCRLRGSRSYRDQETECKNQKTRIGHVRIFIDFWGFSIFTEKKHAFHHLISWYFFDISISLLLTSAKTLL